jgi:hypothetical protein
MIRELFRPVGTDVPLGNRWTPAAGTWQLARFLSLSGYNYCWTRVSIPCRRRNFYWSLAMEIWGKHRK